MRRGLVVLVAGLVLGCESEQPTRVPSTAIRPVAVYVGGRACAGCHPAEAEAWAGSHHDLAMQRPTAESVRGDFADAEYEYAGTISRFFRRDGAFWVRTDGADGRPREFEVAYTFGVEPLQQYLIDLGQGRLQALGIAWDSRPADVGGQVWFHLYPGEVIDSNDPLHWTGLYQNWNAMCADCHSTGLEKNYEAGDGRYATTWTSLDVDCEACHGPGSLHIEAPAAQRLALGHVERSWALGADVATARRTPVTPDRSELETCAHCHARREQFGDDHEAGRALLDHFRPALLDEGLYEADGQILDEVYVYGSFLQSKMHAAGVTCTDCHEPHTARLRIESNGLCTQCHRAETFDRREHHRHEANTAASECVACHMPTRTYMVVDPRRDHSFRVPRPDVSAAIGTPNACNACHANETPAWASAALDEWGATERADHYGLALAAGRDWHADRVPRLRALIDDEAAPAIARATALSLLAQQPGDALLGAMESVLGNGDTDPLVRLAALDQLASIAPQYRIELGQRFLDAPLRAQRMAAARGLATARDALGAGRRADLDAALGEYVAAQRFNQDRPEGLLNLATLYADLGRLAAAEAALDDAIELAPEATASYVNLADVLRMQGRDSEARAFLERSASAFPDDAGLALAYGLLLVREGAPEEALAWLERATERAPAEPYYAYVFGVGLYSNGDTARALQILSDAQAAAPGYGELAYALATMHRDLGNAAEAMRYARRFAAAAPGDARGRVLLDELGRL